MRVKSIFQMIDKSQFANDFISFLSRMEDEDGEWDSIDELLIEEFLFTLCKLNLVDLSPPATLGP